MVILTEMFFNRKTILRTEVEMSKKEKRKANGEEISSLETDLYKQVEKFFSEKKECEKTGSAVSSSISLSIFGGTIRPDVYGIKNPENSDFEVYMGEGKRDLGGRNFDICKGQAISLQRFADYVYLFFPKGSWNYLAEKEHEEIAQECRGLKLGLILVDGKDCEELISAVRNTDLLKDERRVEVKDLVVHYFPSFRSEANAQFFEQFSELAMNIAGESDKLLNKCSDVFRKQTGAGAAYVHIYYDKNKGYFQIAFQKELKQACELFLTINPFGHFLFEKNTPLLIVEQWFTFAWYSQKGRTDNLLRLCNECIKANSKVEVVYVEKENSLVEKMEQLSKIIKNPSNQIEYVVIYQPIKVLGREIRKIIEDVRKSLSELDNFLKSQRKFLNKRNRRS